jgi:hypothetical protein
MVVGTVTGNNIRSIYFSFFITNHQLTLTNILSLVINCTSSTYLMRTASVLRDSTQVKNSSLVLSQNVVAI